MANVPGWVIGGNAYYNEEDSAFNESVSTALELMSGEISTLNTKVMKSFQYQSGTDFVLEVPVAPSNGQTYLLLIKNYRSATSFVFDLYAFAFSKQEDTIVISGNYVVLNSAESSPISSISYEGNTVTISFTSTIYASAFLLKCM